MEHVSGEIPCLIKYFTKLSAYKHFSRLDCAQVLGEVEILDYYQP